MLPKCSRFARASREAVAVWSMPMKDATALLLHGLDAERTVAVSRMIADLLHWQHEAERYRNLADVAGFGRQAALRLLAAAPAEHPALIQAILQDAVREIGEVCCYVAQFDPTGGVERLAIENVNGGPSEPTLRVALAEWWQSTSRADIVVPPAARSCLPIGLHEIESLCWLPARTERGGLGVAGAHAPATPVCWSDRTVSLLRALGDVVFAAWAVPQLPPFSTDNRDCTRATGGVSHASR